MKVVLDTNVILRAISSKSEYAVLIDELYLQAYSLVVSTEILFEYEEVLKRKFSDTVAENFLIALKELPNVYFVKVYLSGGGVIVRKVVKE